MELRQGKGEVNLEFDLDDKVGRAQWETGPQPSLSDVVGNPSVHRSDNPRSAYHLGRNSSRETNMFVGVLSR